jgi:hypothetical protein
MLASTVQSILKSPCNIFHIKIRRPVSETDLQQHDPPVEAGDVALHLVEFLHQFPQPQVRRQQLPVHGSVLPTLTKIIRPDWPKYYDAGQKKIGPFVKMTFFLSFYQNSTNFRTISE